MPVHKLLIALWRTTATGEIPEGVVLRAARSVVAGETAESVASSQGVSHNTIRSRVRGVLEKTGCNRQTDVVTLLSAISSARLPHPS